MNAFRAEYLTVSYEDETVLWDIDFAIEEGKVVGIIGPNGAGKSTLCKAALGLIQPLSGCASFFGQPIQKVRTRVAYVPQRRDVDWNFPITVFEVALMGRFCSKRVVSWASKADKEATRQALEHMGLSGVMDRQISQLSGGQQQRLFVTRALLQNADLYLLDEPFAGVDVASEKVIVDTLKELKTQGKTVLVVHHDLQSAKEYFDQVVLLNVSLIASGSPDQVLTPENLSKAYGNRGLFEEATRLSEEKAKGIEV